MTALRFVAGEQAIFATARISHSESRQGSIVEIDHVGPFEKEDAGLQVRYGLLAPIRADYVIRNAVGGLALVDDWQLRKLDDPEPPPALETVVELEQTA